MPKYPTAQWVAFPGIGTYTDGPFKIIHHTTEGFSASAAIDTYRATGNYPHFTVEGTTIYQHVDTDHAVTALAHPAGTIETNRSHAIQIELVGFAGKPKDGASLHTLGRLCRWLEETHDIPASWPNGPPKPPVNGRDPGNHNRNKQNWRRAGGHYGHCHVPNNIHWDPAYTAPELEAVMTVIATKAAPLAGDTILFDEKEHLPEMNASIPGQTSASEFEAPPTIQPATQASRRSFRPQDYDAPPVGRPAEEMPTPFAVGQGPGSDLLNLHREIETLIFAAGSAFSAETVGDTPPTAKLLLGVGIGPAHRDFESVGIAGPGAPVINLYVAEPMGMDAAKAVLSDEFGIKALSADGHTVNVIHTGLIDAYPHRHPQRPVPCGMSVGHFNVTAGTLGSLVRGRSDPRRKRLLVLSNNHVLANVNEGLVGDAILQPGVYDGGKNPADQIAVLEKWVPIDFDDGHFNYLDCATAWCEPDKVREDFIYRRGSEWAYFEVEGPLADATVGLGVGKSGRTTQLTSGHVIDVNASISVNYEKGRVAKFRDQISIKGDSGSMFSQGGDSGSLIWTFETKRRPVGLLFAGGREITFASKIARVLDGLDVEFLS